MATPHYNQSILQDMFFRDHLEAIHAWTTGSHSSSFVDAILMLKTWLRQRQMDKYHAGTFTGFHATMLLVHLLQSHQLSREASSYQMFRKALTALADSQWDTKPLVMARPNDYVATEGSEAAEAFQKAFDVVFLDRSGHVNFLCDVSR